jgi:Tannase-like family of unknown function (DUF6351)
MKGFPSRVALAALAFAGLALVTAAAAAPNNGGLPQLLVLSNRADLVSGGDALVQVVLPARVDASTVRVTLNGTDVTSAFALRSDGRYTGLVTGLANGDNELIASMRNGPSVHLTVTNHPNGGPIFAGPQVQPWICKNASLGLAPPSDAQCDSPATVSYVYKEFPSGTFKPYDPSSPPPAASIATTNTGVPYVVRIERGAMDRGIYDVAVVQNGWNHKLDWEFGESTAPHHSNGSPKPVLIDRALTNGFMVANNSLNTRGQNANDVVSAEAMMMLKEHITEAYGSIRYTIGEGCSGGSIEQYVLTADYPGLVDGILPNCSFQDSLTTGVEVADCGLLVHYFGGHSGAFTTAQQAAVEGTQDQIPCFAWFGSFFPVGDPSRASNCDLPAPLVYNAATNPGGVRCDLQDYQVAIWGTRPQDGFAKRPSDNVGVQYGLAALNAGAITPQQFVDLNAGIGGINIDNQFQQARTVADPGSVAIAYRSGSVTDGREWANVPIIDLRGSHNTNDIHTDYHSYVARARLDQANGTHANQVIWTWNGGTGGSIVPSNAVADKAFGLMDDWLSRIESDHSDSSLSAKVIRDKPDAAVDACFTGSYFAPTEVTDAATCASTFPHYADARLAAGEALADNVLQCRLKPLNPADYAVVFTAAQWATLQQTFPAGVCDYSQPGVDQQPSIPWLTYTAGPGGQPLPAAPESHPGSAH